MNRMFQIEFLSHRAAGTEEQCQLHEHGEACRQDAITGWLLKIGPATIEVLTCSRHGDTIEKLFREEAWDEPTEEEMTEPGLQPIPIDGPGWYRTASGEHVLIIQETKYQEVTLWYGQIRGDQQMIANINKWYQDGTDFEGYHPWMIVAKEDTR